MKKLEWKCLGVIIKPQKKYLWEKSYCMLPTPLLIKKNTIRIFFSSRNKRNQSAVCFADVDLKNNFKIIKRSKKPSLYPGILGTFDDNGVTPSSIIKIKKKIYLYYIGWKPRCTTRYSLVAGLAISKDNGKKFIRNSKSPILFSNKNEPYSILTAPYVLKNKKKWHMWYVSCEKWLNPDYPIYNIKYAYSENGINWKQTGNVYIKLKKNERAVARPCVFKIKNRFFMFYAYEKFNSNYKIGVAISTNLKTWKRNDQLISFKKSIKNNFFDNKMQSYPSLFKYKNDIYMLYNGNDYGKKGVGLAKLLT